MADSINLSKLALKLIQSHPADGSAIIATSRAVLSGDYDSKIYDTDIFDVFQLVCDESSGVLLSGFGEFDTIDNKCIVNELYDYDKFMRDLYDFYLVQFEKSILNFRKHFGV